MLEAYSIRLMTPSPSASAPTRGIAAREAGGLQGGSEGGLRIDFDRIEPDVGVAAAELEADFAIGSKGQSKGQFSDFSA